MSPPGNIRPESPTGPSRTNVMAVLIMPASRQDSDDREGADRCPRRGGQTGNCRRWRRPIFERSRGLPVERRGGAPGRRGRRALLLRDRQQPHWKIRKRRRAAGWRTGRAIASSSRISIPVRSKGAIDLCRVQSSQRSNGQRGRNLQHCDLEAHEEYGIAALSRIADLDRAA